jgi:hypothetical protein
MASLEVMKVPTRVPSFHISSQQRVTPLNLRPQYHMAADQQQRGTRRITALVRRDRPHPSQWRIRPTLRRVDRQRGMRRRMVLPRRNTPHNVRLNQRRLRSIRPTAALQGPTVTYGC